VTVSPLPIAGFLPADGCASSSMTFTNTSTIASGTISGYQWNFGDGTGTSAATNPSYTYSQPGTYTVTLVATSSEGCTDTITHTVVVHPLPVANFMQISAAGCGPLVVQFTDSSYIATGNVISWFWDFGDGTSSTDQNPSHTYLTSGTYSVTLTVTSDFGCQNSTTFPNIVTVFPGPTAEFEPDPATQSILHPEFNFINQSSGALMYHWTFGDGASSIQFEPNHVYADTGNYMVTLWVVNSYGCKDTVQHPVRVEPEFHWWIPNAFSPNSDGVNDGFNVTGISIVDVKLSIFNRWGDQIFYSEGRNNRDWDGSVVGMPEKAQEGVYVYQVIVKDVWGKTHEKVGQVYLVR
jgi:gliding motility-associated-like protein